VNATNLPSPALARLTRFLFLFHLPLLLRGFKRCFLGLFLGVLCFGHSIDVIEQSRMPDSK
jgi:hypothetical protein